MSIESHDPLSRLALEDAHLSAGASLAGIGGWILPVSFSGLEEEYQAAKDQVALLDASFLTGVIATGKDSLNYLNRRLSQKIDDLPVGSGRRATLLGGDGKMQADMECWRLDEERTLLLSPPGLKGSDLEKKLSMYVFSEDASFEDRSSDWSCFALFGPASPDILQPLSLPAPEKGRIHEALLGDQKVFILQSEFIPNGVLICSEEDSVIDVYDALLDKVVSSGGVRFGFQAFDLLRVESGCPWFGVDTDENTIPVEAGLMSAIHQNKGCYPGQEVLARILNLGHPARQLVGIRWNQADPPEPGSPILGQDQEIGILTSSAYSPDLGHAVGLAMVKWPFRENGTMISTRDGLTGEVEAIIPSPETG